MADRARVLLIRRGKILLIHRFKRGREFWVAPGGHIDPGETAEQAAIREAKEETSLNVMLGKERFVVTDKTQTTHYFSVDKFTGTVNLGGEEAKKNSEENRYLFEWVPLDKMKDIVFVNEETRQKFVELAAECRKPQKQSRR